MKRSDAIIIFSILAALQIMLYSMAARTAIASKPDFVIFYTAAQIVLRGQSDQLYDLDLQRSIQQELGGGIFYPFNYPAFFVPAFLPLGLVPYELAYWSWVVLGILALIVSSVFVVRYGYADLRTASALAFPPILACTLLGQVGTLLLLIFCSTLTLWSVRKEKAAGAVLALAGLKFQYLVPLTVVLICTRQWKVVKGLVVSGVGLLAAFVLVAGWGGLLDYAQLIFHFVRSTPQQNAEIGLSPAAMPTVRGFLSLIVPSGTPLLLATTIGSAIILWLAIRSWESHDLPRSFSVALIASYLAGFHGHMPDMAFLLLPIWIYSVEAMQTGDRFALGVLALLYFPITYYLLIGERLAALLFPVLVTFLYASSRQMHGFSLVGALDRSGDFATRGASVITRPAPRSSR